MYKRFINSILHPELTNPAIPPKDGSSPISTLAPDTLERILYLAKNRPATNLVCRQWRGHRWALADQLKIDNFPCEKRSFVRTIPCMYEISEVTMDNDCLTMLLQPRSNSPRSEFRRYNILTGENQNFIVNKQDTHDRVPSSFISRNNITIFSINSYSSLLFARNYSKMVIRWDNSENPPISELMMPDPEVSIDEIVFINNLTIAVLVGYPDRKSAIYLCHLDLDKKIAHFNYSRPIISDGGRIDSIAISPNGRFLACYDQIGINTNTIEIWALQPLAACAAKLFQPRFAFDHRVENFMPSDDGSKILTCSCSWEDGKVKVSTFDPQYNTVTSQEIDCSKLLSKIYLVKFSADGSKLIVAGKQGSHLTYRNILIYSYMP